MLIGVEDLLAPTRIPPPVQARRHRLLRPRGGRDGRQRADPDAGRPHRRRDPRRRRRTCGRSASPWPAPACCGSSSAWRGGSSRGASRSASSTTSATGCTSTSSRSSWRSSTASRPASSCRARRSTSSLVRFFLGYGLIFLVQSAITIVIAAAVMIVVDPFLALVALAPTPWVVWIAFRYGQRQPAGDAGGPAAHRGAHRRGRGEHRRRARGEGVRAGAAPAAPLQQGRGARVRPVDGVHAPARLLLAVHRLPARSSGLAALLLVGGRQAINGSLTIGEFIAFYGYVLMLTGPMRGLGMALGMAQRAVASGHARVRAARPRAAARGGAGR